MNCEELRPDYVLFAMGVLEDPEKSELYAHLGRGCPACTLGIRESRAVVYALGASAEGPAPPAHLRNRLLASVETAPQGAWHWSTAWQAAAAVVLAAILALVYVDRRYAAETMFLKQEVARRVAETAELSAALRLLQSPETREVNFGKGLPAPPQGRVFVNPLSGVLLVASNLPAPPAGKTYEMWIIPKEGKPAPAGLFASGADGTAVHLYRTPVSLTATGAIAVTLERAGGVGAPTSQPVIVAALRSASDPSDPLGSKQSDPLGAM